MTEDERVRLIQNTADHMSGVTKDIQAKAVQIYCKIDADYGQRIAKAIGLEAPLQAKL